MTDSPTVEDDWVPAACSLRPLRDRCGLPSSTTCSPGTSSRWSTCQPRRSISSSAAPRTSPRAGSGLLSRTEAKLAEGDQKIADLQVIRATLVAARDAGCDDLVECAESGSCPIPFVRIGTRMGTSHG